MVLTLPDVAVQLPIMTPMQQLVEIRLGGDLPGYLERNRAEKVSLRRISADIERRTGIPVNRETLRGWCQELVADAA